MAMPFPSGYPRHQRCFVDLKKASTRPKWSPIPATAVLHSRQMNFILVLNIPSYIPPFRQLLILPILQRHRPRFLHPSRPQVSLLAAIQPTTAPWPTHLQALALVLLFKQKKMKKIRRETMMLSFQPSSSNGKVSAIPFSEPSSIPKKLQLPRPSQSLIGTPPSHLLRYPPLFLSISVIQSLLVSLPISKRKLCLMRSSSAWIHLSISSTQLFTPPHMFDQEALSSLLFSSWLVPNSSRPIGTGHARNLRMRSPTVPLPKTGKVSRLSKLMLAWHIGKKQMILSVPSVWYSRYFPDSWLPFSEPGRLLALYILFSDFIFPPSKPLSIGMSNGRRSETESLRAQSAAPWNWVPKTWAKKQRADFPRSIRPWSCS